MSETKFTKGEWGYYLSSHNEPDGYIYNICPKENNDIIALVSKKRFNGENIGIEEIQSNAKLLAAAPEMFEALEYSKFILQELATQGGWLKEKHNLVNTAIQKAQSAIRKATE